MSFRRVSSPKYGARFPDDPLEVDQSNHGISHVHIVLDERHDSLRPRVSGFSDLHVDISENIDPEPNHPIRYPTDGNMSAAESEPEGLGIGLRETCHMSFSGIEESIHQDLAIEPEQAAAAKPKHRSRGVKRGKTQNSNIALRTWLKIDNKGEATILQADKWKLTHKLGIQLRDMRLLDPNVSTAYTSAILCRDKAIIVNIEHIKAIISTSYVLVINHEHEELARFIEDMKRKLSQQPGGFVGGQGAEKLSDADKLKMYLSPSGMGFELPFELKALEVCLDEMAGHLDFSTAELESTAYPALDALASKVSSPNLERVRRIKNALVRLTTRVETLRGVLEKFMDDDGDMHDLNLTAKELHEAEQRRELAHMDRDSVRSTGRSHAGSSSSSGSSSRSSNSSIEEAETAVVEMLLETYFMNLDNTYNKLQTLHEYVGDTEDLVNIQLDQHRNQLITVDLVLTAFTAALATTSSISGWFGMNLDNGLEEKEHTFEQVVISSNAGAVLLLFGFFAWLYKSRLIVH